MHMEESHVLGVKGKTNHAIGKTHALKKYDQFAQNTSCFYPSCAISRNFWYKNNEFIIIVEAKFREISQF